MSKNDERIIQLKKQIEAKKNQIAKSSRFTPITNCSIELDGIRHNIQVLTKDQLIFLMIKLNSYVQSAEQLELIEECMISGYNIKDWVDDIDERIRVLSVKDEEMKLKAMESKLGKMLSEEKKTELELDEIENLLK